MIKNANNINPIARNGSISDKVPILVPDLTISYDNSVSDESV